MEIQNEEKSLGQKIFASGGKTVLIITALVIIGLAAGYVLGVIGYIKVIGPYAAEIKYKKFLDDYLKPYKEDFFGGDTPEETIDLFIEALKKGDYELASKYFEINKQKNIKDRFKNLDVVKIIDELTNAKKIWRKEVYPNDSVQFWYNINENDSSREINLAKNSNNKWKIESMYIYYLAE